MNAPHIHLVEAMTNAEFWARYAAPGRIGLVGGDRLLNRTLGLAQRRVTPDRRPSRWAHAFLCQGRRADGHHWVIESDLALEHKHVRLGSQENRIGKYDDAEESARVAIVDFGMNDETAEKAMGAALDLVASRTRYALRELIGTLVAMRRPEWRGKPNPLSDDRSAYCSAFVRLALMRAGIDVMPGIEPKHTTPEDLFRSPAAVNIWLLERTPWERETPVGRLRARAVKIKSAVAAAKRGRARD